MCDHNIIGGSKQMAAAGETGIMQQDTECLSAVTDDDGHALVKSDARVNLTHFTFIKVLGKGSFGKVCINASIHYCTGS